MSEAAQVTDLRPQLTLDIGGATVDGSVIAGLTFAKGTRDLDREFKKGSDVRVTFTARVVDAGARDKYDAHGNISETTRRHFLRVDELESVELVGTDNFRTTAQAAADEAKAAEEAAAGEADQGGGES